MRTHAPPRRRFDRAGIMYARAVLVALVLGQASATNCPTYPCKCEGQPGECIVAGSDGEGGQANLGGVRPHISEEDCNPGMIMVYDTPQDGKKCTPSKRVFKTDSPGCDEDATCINTCVDMCEGEPTCKTLSIGANWCAGCKTALEVNAPNGAVAYKKVTATSGQCGGEDVPAGVYCKFTFCPAPTDQPTVAPTTSTTSTQTPMPTQCTPVVQTGPTCLDPPGRVPASEKVACTFPAGTENYGIITKGDAHIPGKQVYKPVLILGDLYDTTPNESGDIASWCGKPPQNDQTYTPCYPNAGYILSRIGGGLIPPYPSNLIDFKSGKMTHFWNPSFYDFAALEELARTIVYGTYGGGPQSGGYRVFVKTAGGSYTYGSLCSNCGLQEYQWGKVMVVFRTDEDITITKVNNENPQKWGGVILAPFSKVTVKGAVSHVDGLVVARELVTNGANQGGIQYHSSMYTGPMECRACKDGCD